MKKLTTILLLGVLLGINLNAAPYERYEHNKMLTENENGQKSINIGGIFAAVDELYRHAGEYPLKFDNDTDKNTAFADLQTLMNVFNFMQEQKMFNGNKEDEFRFNLAFARLFVCAHNFDVNDAAAKAHKAYDLLLSEYSEQAGDLAPAWLNIEFGIFLANSGQLELAKKQFNIAIDKDDKRALYSLALTHLSQNNHKNAKENLEKYLKFYPDDKNAATILEAINNGKIEVKSKK